jgi:hypothetical protein
MRRKALLFCGILSSLVYVALNIFGALRWEGYIGVFLAWVMVLATTLWRGPATPESEDLAGRRAA